MKKYLVKTKWGGIYLISGSPCNYKDINYYDSIYYDHSLKEDEIISMKEIDENMEFVKGAE